MAVILNFPERLETGRAAVAAPSSPAEIVILPCIRRERIGASAGFADRLGAERPSQRQA